jgi:hypothetical protein
MEHATVLYSEHKDLHLINEEMSKSSPDKTSIFGQEPTAEQKRRRVLVEKFE